MPTANPGGNKETTRLLPGKPSGRFMPDKAKRQGLINRALCLLAALLLLLPWHPVKAEQGSVSDAADLAFLGEEQQSPSIKDGGRPLLTIAGHAFGSDMNPVFEQKHPEVEVRFLEGQANTQSDLLLSMTADQAAADLYVLNLSSGLFDAALKKGLALNLSNSEALSAFLEKLASPFQERLTAGDAAFAVPYQLQSRQLFAFNQPLGEALGIARPDSLTALVDLFAGWVEKEGDSGSFLTSQPLWDPMSRFLAYGMDAYIAQHADQADLSFDTPAFHEYISRLEGLRLPMSYLKEAHSGWQEHKKDRCLLIEDYPLLRTQEEVGLLVPGLLPFALPMNAGEEALIPTDLSVFILSAASKNQALALSYLECLVENYPPEQRIVFVKGSHPPVEQPHYQDNRKEYLKQQDQFQQQLQEATDPLVKAALQQQLDQTAQILSEIEAERYVITQDDIDGFLAVRHQIRLMPRVSYAFFDSIPTTKRLIAQFVQGEIDGQAFITQLDQVQRLIRLEGE